jgi:hypothetical protein
MEGSFVAGARRIDAACVPLPYQVVRLVG